MVEPLSYDGEAARRRALPKGMSNVTATFIRIFVGSFSTESPTTADHVVEALPPFAPFKGCMTSEEGR